VATVCFQGEVIASRMELRSCARQRAKRCSLATPWFSGHAWREHEEASGSPNAPGVCADIFRLGFVHAPGPIRSRRTGRRGTPALRVFMPLMPLTDSHWLARFQAGDRAVMEAVYREHFRGTLAAARRVLEGADAETVTHEVFYRLLTDGGVRASFTGGNLGGWIAQIAAHAAIDAYRRKRREVDETNGATEQDVDPARFEEELEAKLLIERFEQECLPAKWKPVFDARFLRQLPQREAALQLGMQRSTLAYQEERIRALLSTFLLAPEAP